MLTWSNVPGLIVVTIPILFWTIMLWWCLTTPSSTREQTGRDEPHYNAMNDRG